MKKINAIKKLHERKLLKKAHVVCVGVGIKTKDGVPTGEEAIICSVDAKVPVSQLRSRDLVPKSLDGIITDVVEVGRIKALTPDREQQFRPAPGGVSIGHYLITAGTLGGLVYGKDENVYILSNNHVLANSNNADLGDEILQPGPHDGGDLRHRIGSLEYFVPINFDGGTIPSCPFAGTLEKLLNLLLDLLGRQTRFIAVSTNEEVNLVDAAIAKPTKLDMVTPEILDIGIPIGIAEAGLGSYQKKSGRSSAFTDSVVIQTDVTSIVGYGKAGTATFGDLFMMPGMSQPGDSGSWILDADNHATGLLFAGSDIITLACRIQNVFSAIPIIDSVYMG
jgi:hypothetical protein